MALDTLAELRDPAAYKPLLKQELQRLAPGVPVPCFLSRTPVDFAGWEGYLFLLGSKGTPAARKIKAREGLKFFEGTCKRTPDGVYELADLACPAEKRVGLLLRKLGLGHLVVRQVGDVPGEDGGEPAEPVEGGAPAPQAGDEGGAAQEAGEEGWEAARGAYLAASDEAEAALRRLGAVLARSGDPDLRRIGARDLRSVTGPHRSALFAVLRELDAPGTRAGAARRARPLVARYLAHLRTSERVRACDANPFGVRVGLVQRVGGALERLDRALAALA